MIEKYNSTHYIERQMRNYHNMIQNFDEMKTERYSLFIQVRFDRVIKKFKAEANSWLEKYALGLKTQGKKELAQIQKEIQEYRESLLV